MSSQWEEMQRKQLPLIEKIIEDETWLEGERRGCAVSREDPRVVENVCGVILRSGQSMRERVLSRFSQARRAG